MTGDPGAAGARADAIAADAAGDRSQRGSRFRARPGGQQT
jgi:hypothetical protein